MEDIDTKHRMWIAIAHVKEKAEEWKERRLIDMDLADLAQEVTRLSQLVVRCERALPGVHIVTTLKEEVQVWKDALPIIQVIPCVFLATSIPCDKNADMEA